MADLVIKISGDIKNYESALEQAESKTEGLSDQLSTLAKTSAVAFAALTGEILLSARAFSESQLAANKLTQSLANQGIYSDDLVKSYQNQAKSLERLTGVDDDAIIKAQSLLQSMIGQQEITEPLTRAVLDLAAAKEMDLETTTNLVGKGIAGHTAALQKLGITVDEHLSKEERTAKIIELVTNRFGGQAEAANRGLGSIKGLASAFGDFQEEIGKRFAPFLEAVIGTLTHFFEILSDNPVIMDFVASLITAGTVLSGIGLIVGTAGIAFLKLQAALEAAKVATTAMEIATKGLVAATGLGLLLVIATEIYLNWSTIWPKLQALYRSFVNDISGMSAGLSKILSAAFHLDAKGIQAGLDEVKAIFNQNHEEVLQEEQAHQNAKREIKNQARTQEQMDEAFHEEMMKQQDDDFKKLILEKEAAFQELSQEQKNYFNSVSQAKLRETLETEKSIRLTYAQQQLAEDIKTRNNFLLEQQKFGTAYALINQQMHSEIYKGTQKGTTELAGLVQSKNATLKGIGKAAAVANITMKTAESAMNIYAGFSTIPIIGPVLGIAGAAAAIAFGAEQVGNVLAAAEGGLITGGIPGVDSVPVLAQQGELVVPAKNYEEVVNSVAASRSGGSVGPGGGTAEIIISLKDDLMDFIETKLIERQRLNISMQGAS